MGCVCTNDTANEYWSEVNDENYKEYTEDETDQKPMKVEFLNNSSLISSKRPKRKMILKEGKLIDLVPFDFNAQILEFINEARSNPSDFARLIASNIQFIKENPKKKKNKFLFEKPGICKIGLAKGHEAFKDAAEMMSLRKPIKRLEYKQQLSMVVSNELEEWTNREFLECYLEEKSKCLKFSYFGFHFDLGVVDAETSVCLQVVDDNNFLLQRRNNILNPLYKYIGLGNKKMGNNFCLYLTFAG